MVFSVRLNDEEGNMVKSYIEDNGLSISDFLRSAVLERLERGCYMIPDEMEVVREVSKYSSKSERKKGEL